MTDSSSVLSGWWGFKGATSGDWPGCTLWARAQSDTGKENIESFQHQWTMKNHEGSIHTKNAHTLIYTIHTHRQKELHVRLNTDNRHLSATFLLLEHDITQLMVWMCVQRDVVQDEFMLTSSQAMKWQSSKRADCKVILFTTFLTGPWLISPVKTIIQRIPLCKVLQVNVTTCLYQCECINSSTGDSSLCLISWSWR